MPQDNPAQLAASTPPRPHHTKLLTPRFARILLAQTTFGFGWSLFLLTPKFYTTQLNAGPEVIGSLTAMSGLFAVATIAVALRVIDRHGRTPLFRVGCAVLLLLSVGYLSIDSVAPQLYLFHGLIGTTFVLSFNATATLATDEAPPERLGEAVGMLGASNMSMNAVATVVAEHLAEAQGWDSVFALAGFTSLVSFAASFGLRERRRAAPMPERTQRPEAQLRVGPLMAPLLATVLVGTAFSAMFIFYQPYAISLGAEELQWFFIGFTSTAVGVRIFFGNLGDRYGRRRLSVYAACLYALTAASMIHLDPELLIGYGALFGLAHGVLYPTLNALVVERVEQEVRGRAMTLYNGCFNLGTGFSSLGWGIVAERRGYPSVFIGALVVALLAASAVALSRRAR